ncbi:DUF5330 domain-containing protein [Bartonella sp. CB189]|uniref:DUF5330 domain-containing protein n=1 Tax=Bartonella sp. CB189 TaxID=3112254 RepID=UPI003FA56C1B
MIVFRKITTNLLTFCDHNTEVCKIGKSSLSLLGEYSYHAAQIAHRYLGSHIN